MGLFSGLIGGLFGGSKTKQTVKSTNTTTVKVNVANQINVDSLAKVLEGIKNIFKSTTENQQQLQKLTLVTLAANTKAELEQNALLASLLKFSKLVVIAGFATLFWFIWRKKRKSKRKRKKR